jgi:hypothetical protein
LAASKGEVPMSAASSRHAIDTLPIKVYCRDGSQITVKLGPLATFFDLHRALVMKVRGMKEQMVLKDSDPLLRFFSLFTVTTETYLGTQIDSLYSKESKSSSSPTPHY